MKLGLAGAEQRGEAARVAWVRNGEVVSGSALAQAWGLDRKALSLMVARGELFAVRVQTRLYFPSDFLSLEREAVAKVCKALGSLSPSEKFMLWKRSHGSLADETVVQTLRSNVPRERVVALARAWAAERGKAAPVPASAGSDVRNKGATLNEILAVPANWIDRQVEEHFMELLASDKLIPTETFSRAPAGPSER